MDPSVISEASMMVAAANNAYTARKINSDVRILNVVLKTIDSILCIEAGSYVNRISTSAAMALSFCVRLISPQRK